MSRIIGIRHRIKKTKDGEARPTQLSIIESGVCTTYELESELSEHDFLVGAFPIKWKKLEEGEESDPNIPIRHLKNSAVRREVPIEYDGLRSGDKVAMALGGSGDYFAFALSLHGETIGAEVFRITPAKLKEARGESEKNDDTQLLAELLQDNPELFLDTTPKDRNLILLREVYDQLEQARKDRIACEQRIMQLVIGKTYCTPELYHAGALEKAFDTAKSNNKLLALLKSEEARLQKDVEEALGNFPIWTEVLTHVHGCGPKTAARIIAGAGDVRKFANIAKWKAYCGVHLMRAEEGPEGPEFIFPRRRSGQVSNWNDQCRQGFYLMVQYWIKTKDSEWGQKFLQYKANFQAKHPEVVVSGKRKMYTKGHIHQMATARTMTRFAEYMYRQWSRLENEAQ